MPASPCMADQSRTARPEAMAPYRTCRHADGMFLGCKFGVRADEEDVGDSIINLSSIDGIIGEAELAAVALTRALSDHTDRNPWPSTAPRRSMDPLQLHPSRLHLDAADRAYLRDLGELDEERAIVSRATDRPSGRAERRYAYGSLSRVG